MHNDYWPAPFGKSERSGIHPSSFFFGLTVFSQAFELAFPCNLQHFAGFFPPMLTGLITNSSISKNQILYEMGIGQTPDPRVCTCERVSNARVYCYFFFCSCVATSAVSSVFFKVYLLSEHGRHLRAEQKAHSQ